MSATTRYFRLAPLLIFCSILFDSCKKYDENPLINLHSKNTRVEGSYRVAGYMVNGIDSTQALNEQLTSSYDAAFVVHFLRNDNKKVISGTACQGDWELVDEKRMLRINISNATSSAIGPFVTKNQLDWRITKLTDNHIHLKVEHEGLEYLLWLHEE